MPTPAPMTTWRPIDLDRLLSACSVVNRLALHAIAAMRRGISPGSPAWSRQSATSSSHLQSPTQQSQSLTCGSVSRTDEPADVERLSVGSRQPGKRKVSTISSDSDIDVIESPRALKKVKPTPVKPTRGRKK